MYRPYEQNRNDAITRLIEHDETPDGHAIRLTTPVQIRQYPADGPGVAYMQLCHGQKTEIAAIDATIARLQATIEELEAVRRAKGGR